MCALLIKFIARFVHFMVSLVDSLKRPFGQLWQNFASNLYCWTLNHQHAYVECDMKKIWWPSIINLWPFAVIGPLFLNNVENFAEGFRCEAFQNTAEIQNWSRSTYRNAEFLVNGLLESFPKVHFFIEKLYSATMLIFGSMDT